MECAAHTRGDRSAAIPHHYADDVSGRSPLASKLASVLGIGFIAGLAGCSNPTAAPTVSTIAVTSTAYVTIPARDTTSTIERETGGGDNNDESESNVADDPTQERVYEIKAGDYLVGIAADFDVPVNYLPEYNGWTDGLRHALVPGEEMRIPPSGWEPNGPAAPTDTSDASASDENANAGCAQGEQPGTYTVQSGDTPGRIAVANDVTVAELAAANQGVADYAGFVVGIEITIPC